MTPEEYRAFGYNLCCVCEQWKPNTMYLGPTHRFPVCTGECISELTRMNEIYKLAFETKENDENQ